MRPVLILKCSPRLGGVTDTLADYFKLGMEGLAIREIALREKRVLPCQNCGLCAPFPHFCPLDDIDDCKALYDAFDEAGLVLFASPIYFYALPAHFKAFIDRGQRFWQDKTKTRALIPVLCLLAAGRPRGDKLFEGALRTITWFLRALKTELTDSLCFRGLDNILEINKNLAIKDEIITWAQKWALLTKRD